MAVKIKVEDYTDECMDALKSGILSALEEVGGAIEAQAKRNSRVNTGQTKGSWDHHVNKAKYEVSVGSPLENAIWEEFGTGEYAVNGNGRQGYWVYVKSQEGQTVTESTDGKVYTLGQAKRIMAMLRAEGLDAYYTNGKSPNRTLERAFKSKKNKIKTVFKGCVK